MRKFFVGFAICFCCIAAHGQKTRYGQEPPHPKPGTIYPIKVHISGIHTRTEYEGGGLYDDGTYVDAIIDGKKVELQVNHDHEEIYGLPPLGDLQARLLKEPRRPNNTPLFREYELLLPNNTIWRCNVTGIFE
jgi:hypothetical protein